MNNNSEDKLNKTQVLTKRIMSNKVLSLTILLLLLITIVLGYNNTYLRKDLHEREEKIDELEEDKVAAETQIVEMEDKINEYQKEVALLEEEEKIANEKIVELKAILTDYQEEIAGLNSAKKELKKELSAVKEENEGLKAIKKDLKKELETVYAEKEEIQEALNTEIDNLEAEKEAAREEINELENTLNDYEQTMEKLKTEKLTADEQIANLKALLEETEEEKEELMVENHNLERTKVVLEEKLTTFIQKKEEIQKVSEDKIDNLREELEKERLRKEELESEIESINAIVQKAIYDDVYESLQNEFSGELDRWEADIIAENLTFRFNDLGVKFGVGESEISPSFENILQDFFPRYVQVLKEFPFSQQIEELRIEGQASSNWAAAENKIEAYINNINLSQRRAANILDYCLSLSESQKHFDWLDTRIIASGMSSSQPIKEEIEVNEKKVFKEDKVRSRRVDFRIITSTDEIIKNILEMKGKM